MARVGEYGSFPLFVSHEELSYGSDVSASTLHHIIDFRGCSRFRYRIGFAEILLHHGLARRSEPAGS